jgi:hypothetical protein
MCAPPKSHNPAQDWAKNKPAPKQRLGCVLSHINRLLLRNIGASGKVFPSPRLHGAALKGNHHAAA